MEVSFLFLGLEGQIQKLNWCFPTADFDDRIVAGQCYCGCTNSCTTVQKPRNAGMVIPLQIPTNLMVSNMVQDLVHPQYESSHPVEVRRCQPRVCPRGRSRSPKGAAWHPEDSEPKRESVRFGFTVARRCRRKRLLVTWWFPGIRFLRRLGV